MDIKVDSLARFQSAKSQDEAALQHVDKLKASAPEELKKVARDFESLFMDIVLKAMRQSVVKSGLIDGGNAEEIYQGMLDSEYSKIMAEQGTTGLAQMIEKQVLGKMRLGHDTSRIAKEINGKRVYGQERLHEVSKNQTMK